MDTRAFREKRRRRLFRQVAEDSGFGREPKTEPVPTRIRHAVDAEHLAMGYDTEKNYLPEESMTHVRRPYRTTSPSTASSIGKASSRVETPGLSRSYETVNERTGRHPMAMKKVTEPSGMEGTGRAGTRAPDGITRDTAGRTKALSHYPAGGPRAGRATNPLQEVLGPRRRKIFALDPNYRPSTEYDDSRGERPVAAAAPSGEGDVQSRRARGKPEGALAHYQEGPSQTGVAGPPNTQVVGSQVGGKPKFSRRRRGQMSHRARLFAGARQGAGFYQEGSPA